MNVLVACEFSGTVREAFRAKGHKAYSCDVLPSDDNSPYHLRCNVLNVLNGYDGFKWDLMIAHPPCTHLASSGARWFKDKLYEQQEAIRFFCNLALARIDKICIENPIGIISSKWRKPDQIIQPWEFGHEETKATCLWLKNLPLLKPTNIVGPPPKNMTPDQKRHWNKVHYASPGKDRWKKRSVTYSGIAQAMADTWG